MIVDLRPYPAYKDSGVAWLGKVPEHWDVLPNRALFEEVKQRDHSDEQMLSVTITRGVVRQHALLAESSKKDSSNLDRSAYKLVCPGDVAYNKMRAWQGAIGASGHRGIVSPAYVVVRPQDGADYRYLHHLFRTPAFANEAERWSYGITSDMWSLRPEHFRMICACLPPAREQSAIVRFLDHADRRIRRYILAKQKLIKLLEEQKQAIIHRAVTRGLDPNVRLKPSDVEWLGEVPEHWEVKRLKALCRMQSGESITGPSIEPLGAYPVYGGNGVRGYTAAYTHDGAYALVGRQGALCGNVHVARGRFWASEHAVVASLFHGHDLAWFSAVLTEMNLNQYSIAAAQPGLAVDRVLNLCVPVPPEGEQQRIAQHLASETAGIVNAVDHARREISLLREYRTRVIADVVTGKLDVREAAASLPDESHEPDVLDDADALVEGDVEAGDAELSIASEGVEE